MNVNGDDEMPSVVSFFSKRAKLVAKVTDEDLKAAEEMMSKIQKSRNKTSSNEKKVSQPGKKSPRKNSKNKKKTAPEPEPEPEAEEILVDDENLTNTPEVKLSPAAKRRLKKIQLEKEQELERMEAENEKILSAIECSVDNVIEEDPPDTFDKLTILTVSYLSEISRVKCNENDKFSTIFGKVAESFNLKMSEFLLSFNEQIIKIEDTPKSLNLNGSDILECIPYIPDENTVAEAGDANNLKILFQTNDSKQKLEIVAHKLEKMQDIMEKYSKLRSVPLNLLAFEFDGEEISGTETPDDLDMESGSCIDVRVLTSHKKTKKTTKREPVIYVDSGSNDSDILCVEDH